MKKLITVMTLLICLALLIGCQAKISLIDEELDKVNRIQVVLAMGNPVYGAESKIIEDEIAGFIEAFGLATLGKRVADDDVVVSDTSKYILYNGSTEVYKISFNGNDSTRVWYKGHWYYVNYENQSPYELYKASPADIVTVDEDLHIMPVIPTPKEVRVYSDGNDYGLADVDKAVALLNGHINTDNSQVAAWEVLTEDIQRMKAKACCIELIYEVPQVILLDNPLNDVTKLFIPLSGEEAGLVFFSKGEDYCSGPCLGYHDEALEILYPQFHITPPKQ